MSHTNGGSEMGLFFILLVEEIIFSKLPYYRIKNSSLAKILASGVSLIYIL